MRHHQGPVLQPNEMIYLGEEGDEPWVVDRGDIDKVICAGAAQILREKNRMRAQRAAEFRKEVFG